MIYKTLVDTQMVADHLNDPDWVVVDCRFDLMNPEWGFRDYQDGHIPGAVFADLNRDLSAAVTECTGRHPMPDAQACKEMFGRLGITQGKQVVVYDTSAGGMAVRLWFMLRVFGHTAAALLDGGFAKWVEEGRQLAQGEYRREAVVFTGEMDESNVVSTAEMERIVADGSMLILDARAPERYRGDVEPIDPVAGHIPGAVNDWYLENLNPDGTFLKVDLLAEKYTRVLNGRSPGSVVVYCGSGVTSCHLLLAMEYAGYPGAKLYAGSWSEWIRDPKRSVAR